MRVVLVSSPTRTQVPNYVIPTGLLSLAAWLEKNGHEVRVIDAAALREPDEKIVARVREFAPQIIGVGGIITAYSYIIGITRALKATMPDIPIVLGGQVVINNVDLCYRHMPIDYIIHGYGEIALEKLVRHLEGKLEIERIPGLCYKLGGRIVENPGREFFPRMDDMPFPAYHLIDMEHYATVNGKKFAKLQKYLDQTGKKVKNHRFITVMGTLGCTDRCTFCVHEQEFVGLKAFSNEYLLRHIELLHKTYDIHVFAIGEEMFLTTVKRAAEFNRLMKERLPDVYWSASTRANHVTPELIQELETGNCFFIGWGFESGSQKMLDIMKKRIRKEHNVKAFYDLDNSKIVAAASLMVGNVGETNETIKETIEGIRQGGLYGSAVFFASPYPGGRSWDWALERGIIKDPHAYLMAASDKDAAARINCNLTPYPDFILKAWQKILLWELQKQNLKKQHRLHSHISLARKVKLWLKLMFGFYFIPPTLLPAITGAYFAWYKLSRRFYRTEKDRRYEFSVDPDGALRVEKLIVGDFQRHMTPEKLEALVEKARERQRQALAL